MWSKLKFVNRVLLNILHMSIELAHSHDSKLLDFLNIIDLQTTKLVIHLPSEIGVYFSSPIAAIGAHFVSIDLLNLSPHYLKLVR